MKHVIHKLEEIKKELNDVFLTDDGEDESLIKLIRTNMDEDLQETLILNHSKEKANLQSLRLDHFKTMSKIVDASLEGFKKVEAHHLNKHKAPASINKFFGLTFKQMMISLFAVLGCVGLLLWMVSANLPAAELLVETFKPTKK